MQSCGPTLRRAAALPAHRTLSAADARCLGQAPPSAACDSAQDRGDHAVTAREMKVVELAYSGLDALDQQLLQPAARTMQARLDRLFRNPEALRGLGSAHAFDGSQHEYGSKVIGQLGHCGFE